MTISAGKLRQLLDAEDPAATLVLFEGRVRVVSSGELRSDEYSGALEVISREDLRAQLGGRDVPDRELEEVAARLETATTNRGG